VADEVLGAAAAGHAGTPADPTGEIAERTTHVLVPYQQLRRDTAVADL
jgi:hypothetical protein